MFVVFQQPGGEFTEFWKENRCQVSPRQLQYVLTGWMTETGVLKIRKVAPGAAL